MLQQEGSFGATRATFAEMKTPLAGLLSRSYVGRIFLALRRLHFCNSAAARVGAGNGLETRCGRRQDRHRDPKPPGPSYRPEASPLFARSPHRVVRTPRALHLGNEGRLSERSGTDCYPCIAGNRAAMYHSTCVLT